MTLRTKFRGSLPYAVAVIGGFLVAYLIVAFVIFLVIRQINRLKRPADESPATHDCPFCLSDIPVKASRCPHCTSELKTAAV